MIDQVGEVQLRVVTFAVSHYRADTRSSAVGRSPFFHETIVAWRRQPVERGRAR